MSLGDRGDVHPRGESRDPAAECACARPPPVAFHGSGALLDRSRGVPVQPGARALSFPGMRDPLDSLFDRLPHPRFLLRGTLEKLLAKSLDIMGELPVRTLSPMQKK